MSVTRPVAFWRAMTASPRRALPSAPTAARWPKEAAPRSSGAAPSLRLCGTVRIGGTHILGPIALEVGAGRWTCLLGPSGVGKSTVLRLMAGLDEDVSFEGELAAGDGAPLAGRVALMAQSDLLLPWLDLMDNVTLGASLRGEWADRSRAWDVLTRVGLVEHVGKRPAALSGGQRQRAALARTLMEDRPVVLLDEPFSALDAGTRARMQDLAADLLSGRTVLHVTHDAFEAARLGEDVVVMTRSGLRRVDPPDAPIPRAYDHPDTLAFQGRLLRLLLEMA